MADNIEADVKLRAAIDWGDAEQDFQKRKREFQDLEKMARQTASAMTNMAKSLSTSHPLTTPAGVRQFLDRELRSTNITGKPFSSVEDFDLAANAPAPLRSLHETYKQYARQQQQVQEQRNEVNASRNSLRDFSRTPMGGMARMRAARRRQRVFVTATNNMIDEEDANDPDAIQFREATQLRQERRQQEASLFRKQHRSQVKREVYAAAGIAMPEDLSPFAKMLQNTVKSAMTLGMLESLSGGSAVPLVRALASNVIAGALLPAAIRGAGIIGTGVSSVAGGLATGIGAKFGASSGAAAKAASQSADAGKVAGDAAAAALKGMEGGAGIGATAGLLGGPFDEVTVPGGAAAGATIGGIAALLGLGVGAGAGGILYASSKIAGKNTIEQNLTAATGGAGTSSPDRFIQDIVHSGQTYMYHPDVVTNTMTAMANMGVSQSQLRGNTDNALMLARMTGGDPGDMAKFVATLSTQHGGSSDSITKMIELMTIQNKLTADQGVPLNSMLANMQTLVANTGGIPVGAGMVAGVAGIAHVLAQTSPAGRTPGLAGQAMAPLLGATGFQSVQLAAMLGMPLEQFNALQKSPNGAVGLFQAESNMFRRYTKDMPGSSKLTMTEGMLSSLGLAQGMGSSQIEAYAQALLNPASGSNAAAMAKKFMGQNLDINKFKAGVSTLSGEMVSLGEQGIINIETKVLDATAKASDHLATIIDILNRAFPAPGISPGDTGVPPGHPGTAPTPGGGPGSSGQGGSGGTSSQQATIVAHKGYPKLTYGTNGQPDYMKFPDGYTMTLQQWIAQGSGGGGSPPGPGSGGGGKNFNWTPGMTVPKYNNSGTNERVPLTRDMLEAATRASAITGIPVSVLLAQAAHETGLQGGGAGGIAQFTDPRAIAAVNNSAAWKKLRLGNFDPTNPGQALIGEGIYDKLSGGGSVYQMLSNYNAGAGAVGAQRAAGNLYASKVMSAANDLQQTFTIDGTFTLVDSSGNTIGHGQAGGKAKKKGAH